MSASGPRESTPLVYAGVSAADALAAHAKDGALALRQLSDAREMFTAWEAEGLGTCPEIGCTNYPDAWAELGRVLGVEATQYADHGQTDLAEAQAMIAADDIELQERDATIECLTAENERLRAGINVVTTRLDALVRP